MFKIIGKIKNKKYVSRKKLTSHKAASKYAYSKVYKKNGNDRRKNQLHDFYIVEFKKKRSR